MYDWAYSAFTTVVVTFVFPTYFVRAVAADAVSGTASFALAQTIAGLVIAMIAAPLGALADAGGRRRLLLACSTAMMAGLTAGLWFVHPRHADAALALGLTAAATVAFETATVFYNAMLPEIAAGRGGMHLGRISGLAWASGYAGGLVALTVCLVVLISPTPPLFGLSAAAAEPVRAAAPFAACWIALFSWPLLVFGPRDRRVIPWRAALAHGAATLRRTVTEAIADHGMRRFLLARMLYTDGLTALFAFGGIYAAGTFGMDAGDVLRLGIALNVTAGIGAAAFALIEDRIGAKSTVLIALSALIVSGAGALLVRHQGAFWICALALGAFVGPAQAASRSLMARLVPAETRSAGFGLYALSGRVTGFVGPLALGMATAWFASQRAGMAAILVLLAAGAVLLAGTRLPATSG